MGGTLTATHLWAGWQVLCGAASSVGVAAGARGGVRGAAWIWDGRGASNGGLHALGDNRLTYDGIIHAVDWLPTLCALAGGVVPAPVPASQRHRYGLDVDGLDARRRSESLAPRLWVQQSGLRFP